MENNIYWNCITFKLVSASSSKPMDKEYYQWNNTPKLIRNFTESMKEPMLYFPGAVQMDPLNAIVNPARCWQGGLLHYTLREGVFGEQSTRNVMDRPLLWS